MTFNEKVQWRKLYDRRPVFRQMTDKVAAREYAAARVGPDYLVPLLGVYEKPADIPWAELPVPYVVKAAHGCGWNLFVLEAAEADPAKATRTLRGWLRKDFYYKHRGWAYKGLPRRLIVERFIGSGRNTPDDFKFFCFDGVPRVIYVIEERFSRLAVTCYDAGWAVLPFHVADPQGAIRPAPPELGEMLRVAGALSHGFDFLRVDLYCVDGHVYCGELTVYPAGGLWPYSREYDEWLGGFWTLPRVESPPLIA